jgi:hypothetical protein
MDAAAGNQSLLKEIDQFKSIQFDELQEVLMGSVYLQKHCGSLRTRGTQVKVQSLGWTEDSTLVAKLNQSQGVLMLLYCVSM